MRVIFIVGQAANGGIETYCLRMARALARQGVAVELWIVKRLFHKPLLDEFAKWATIRWLSPRWLPYPMWFSNVRIPDDAELVWTTGRLSLIHGAVAATKAKRPVRLIAGVFSQWEYAQGERTTKAALSHHVLRQLGPANIVFCTEGCRTDHAAVMGPHINRSPVSPLLVDLPSAPLMSNQGTSGHLHVLTIANFTPFKTICVQIPHIVKALTDQGIDVEWTLYGSGEMQPAIEEQIAKTGTRSRIHLLGRLSYSDMQTILSQADLYVGSGTTIIEASASGVPTIVGLDDNPEPTTPGYFAERVGTYTSDRKPGEPLRPIVDVIAEYQTMPIGDRNRLREASIEKARRYDIANAFPEVQRVIAVAEPVRVTFGIALRLRYAISTFIEAIRYIVTGEADKVR